MLCGLLLDNDDVSVGLLLSSWAVPWLGARLVPWLRTRLVPLLRTRLVPLLRRITLVLLLGPIGGVSWRLLICHLARQVMNNVGGKIMANKRNIHKLHRVHTSYKENWRY